MKYEIVLTDEALRHLELWKKSGQKKTIAKIMSLFKELEEHPATGTGQVERLRGEFEGYWSRRIDKQSRLVYTIEDDVVRVIVVSMRGHYGDK